MVDFSFISARFLGANDAEEVLAAPGEHNPVYLRIDPAEGNPANLSVVFPVVDPLHDLVCKDFGSGQERDTVFGEVGSGLVFIPLKFQLHAITPAYFYNTQTCTRIAGSFSARQSWCFSGGQEMEVTYVYAAGVP